MNQALQANMGPVVMRRGDHRFIHHRTLEEATREAHRLARTVGDEFFVFVPMRVIRPPDILDEPIDWSQEDLPF